MDETTDNFLFSTLLFHLVNDHPFHNLKISLGERIWLSFDLNDVCKNPRISTGLRIEIIDFTN